MNKDIAHSTLISQLKNSEEKALRQLFDLYADDIYDTVYRILKDPYESEDVVQEVFVKVWNARFQLDETGNIWSFIYVIARRLSLNRLRDLHAQIRNQVVLLETNFSQIGSSDNNILVQEILALEHEVLGKLPEQQRKVYVLSRVEGLTHKEIASQMNIAPNTVKNHIIQALKTFKKHFQRFGYPLIFLFFH